MLSGRLDELVCQPPTAARRRVWREVEWLLLAALVLGVYFSRLTDLTIRGEESRWARVAQEMLESGDWIVPRQQGEPFPDRPPLNSWAMMAASQLTGEMNLLAIRLPSALATLLTTLAVYFYSRNFLSRVGAFAGGAAYATMAQVLQLGRVAESDALLTLCVAGALFCWHYGYACRNHAPLAWVGGYALTALAGLSKGPQGPVYFVAITAIFLSLRRDWRFLFNRWHLAGLGTFALIVGLWQLPFMFAVDAESARSVWSEGGDVASRFQIDSLSKAFAHWGTYPLELWVCMMPWSFLLPVLATRWLRQNLGEARPMAGFLLTACAVAFPTCWLPVDSRTRYFMSLYPCVAPLVGLVIERSWETRQVGWWQRSWARFALVSAGGILFAAAAVGVMRVIGRSRWHDVGESMSTGFVLTYGLAAIVAAATMLFSRLGKSSRHVQVGILALAAFMGLSYTGVVVNIQMGASNDPSAAVAAVREMIPPGDRLVSFGRVHHLFAYYFQEPIELQPLRDGKAPAECTATYFCFAEDPAYATPTIPFGWDLVAEISCERSRTRKALAKVVVGRRRAPIAGTEPGDDSAADRTTPLAVLRGDDSQADFEDPARQE